ncbi:amino acid ABC transporter substrate-binding protein [candidate division KSB3 bacterium]|uniref:Amino acid ABC transporter substrate-binding protein n=1 Tax=candidate division KSB3 bacterium TaxID=2044937 RepID=A0A2G6E834_9BACT|nr:MAG: amino acid ABC transporter substrate-binding protein [candidate division KSB3 bacterium]PIE30557.1 MAG: amino acid ABC transporter substrate-binding protein [candidate division KSB3 bacterium]
MKKSILMPGVFMAMLILSLSAGVFAQDIRQQLVRESTLEQILQRGVLKVGMSTFVPWAMKAKDGEFVGFEVDVARRLAADMGVEVEFVPTKWSGIIPALLTGKFDVIIGGMGIRPDRNIKVNFSIPYDYSGMSIVADKEKAAGFRSIDDFNRAEVAIAARTGTTAAASVKKYLPEAKLKLFDNEAQTIQELLNGRVHAVVASAPFPASQAIKYADRLFLPLEETFTREPIGFALRKGDVDTLNYFDNWIRVVDSEGWLKERHTYWFRTEDWKDLVE